MSNEEINTTEDWFKKELQEFAREMILAESNLRANKWSWKAFHAPKDTPEGQEYYQLSEVYERAASKFWMATDVEYDDHDPIRAACWEWRYQKVMARKCCWSQRGGSTDWAASQMSKLGSSERNLMRLIGIEI